MIRSQFPACVILAFVCFLIAFPSSLACGQDAAGDAFGKGDRERLALIGNISATSPVRLKRGDRIVLLGGTYIERLQLHNYFETLMGSALPNHDLTFRNLGWSGDNVWGHARAVFGAPDEGFKRLEKDLDTAIGDHARPLVMLHYGGNEAHRGQAKLDDFVAGLNRLLDNVQKRTPRIILILPRPYETKSPPLPNPETYNNNLELYREAIKKVAEDRKLQTIDLARVLENATDNGVHPTEQGHRLFARSLVEQLGVKLPKWELELDARSLKHRHLRIMFSDLKALPTGVQFRLQSKTLLQAVEPSNKLKITSLAFGNYELIVDGKQEHVASAKEWAGGVKLRLSADAQQFDTLRAQINEKNELFFHRHRPQNETYLFLFRKHEQGNNAVEIPQFDPLIAAKEEKIAALTKSRSHVVELKRTE